MKAPRKPRPTRKQYDSRADTPEARAIRAERRMRRFYCSCGTTPRHHYAHWLNELIQDRTRPPATPSYPGQKPAPPAYPAYPFGNDVGRRLIRDAQSSHSRSQSYLF